MPNKKYIPSNSIKKRITEWEGSSMQTNRSFDLEAADFQRRLEMAKIYDQMSQDELDALFSYSYNVGSTTFAKRTIPHLVKLYNGTGTLNNVLNNIYGTKDKTLPGLRKRRDIERQLFKDAYNRRTSQKKTPKTHVYQFPQEIDRPQQELNSVPSYAWNPSIVLQEPENQQISEPQNSYTTDVRYPTRKRIESQHTGGRLIKRGQYGTPLYHKTLYLEKDGDEQESPHKELKSWIPDITPEERMDQTVQELSNGLSTYQPTKEQKRASEGIYHPKRITDWLGLAPVVVPAAIAAGVTLPEWGPTAIATASNPAFWGELIKDTGTYIAANVASQRLTNKDIGAHVNNAIGLEEDHPIGDFITFGGVNPTRKLIKKVLTSKEINGSMYSKLGKEYLPKILHEEKTPYGTKVIQSNGKIRLRLLSHTDEFPRELVIDPQEGNSFYVHIRTWNGDKIPANLSQKEIKTLQEALYNELPIGAEILIPESGPGNYATRGTIAALKRLGRDPRYSQGRTGKVLYDDNGKIKKFNTTSFIKSIQPDYDYINRQLIPLAKEQGNWQGANEVTDNIAKNTVWKNLYNGEAAGMFSPKGIVMNSSQGPLFIPSTYLHEIRHAFDFSTKFNLVTFKNPLLNFLGMSPTKIFKRGTLRPIQLNKQQLQLLDKAYPTKLMQKFPFSGDTSKRISEKIATNAEMRYMFDQLYFNKFGTKPTVSQLNTFINTLPDEEFVKVLLSAESGYIETYLMNIVKKFPKGEYFDIYVPSYHIPTKIRVNKNIVGSQALKDLRQAITSVPSVTGIGYGIYNFQQNQ